MRRLGVHTSIAGGLANSLERARELGCSTLQIFSHNPRGWNVSKRDEEDVCRFRELRRVYDLSPVVIHTSYLINLASADKSLMKRSLEMMVTEMDIADTIGADYVVLHTGSASGDDPHAARNRAAECLCEISNRGKWKAGLLLENTAGERGDISSKIAEIAEIIESVPTRLISGICFDTCHAFAAGYDLRSRENINKVADDIRRYLEPGILKVIHLNDSKKRLGSGVDRHEHIGKGMIGKRGFRHFLHNPLFAPAPIILETPKKTDGDDINNLRIVRRLLVG